MASSIKLRCTMSTVCQRVTKVERLTILMGDRVQVWPHHRVISKVLQCSLALLYLLATWAVALPCLQEHVAHNTNVLCPWPPYLALWWAKCLHLSQGRLPWACGGLCPWPFYPSSSTPIPVSLSHPPSSWTLNEIRWIWCWGHSSDRQWMHMHVREASGGHGWG